MITQIKDEIKEFFKQLFCKHEWYRYGGIDTVKNHKDGYNENWLICRKCEEHKIITIFKRRVYEIAKGK